MCAMSHSALVGMTSDPRSGVVAGLTSFHIVMETEDFGDMKEALVRKLNSNKNKFYPDAGGIMMGYSGIKMMKSTSEVTSTTLLQGVYIRAQFFLFKPQVGSELQCIVSKKEEGIITCLAHGVFKVEVINPPKCWETVFVGQTITAEVVVVEQLAWHEPRILASLLGVTDHHNVPHSIDVVDEFDNNEFESVTDSGMFEYEHHQVSNSASHSRGNDNARFRVSTSLETAGGDIVPSIATKKRKAAEERSASEATPSPVKKKAKKNRKSSPEVSESVTKSSKRTRSTSKSSVDSDTSPTSQSSSSEPHTDSVFPVHHHPVPAQSMPPPVATSPTKQKKDPPPPSPVKIVPPPVFTSPDKGKQISKKSPSKILTKILPKPSSDQDSDSDDDATTGNSSTKATEPKVGGISAVGKEGAANDTVVPGLLRFEALNNGVSINETTVSPPPKTPGKEKKGPPSKGAPPGFTDGSTLNANGKKRVSVTAPSGERFGSYKAAWDWTKENPDYMVKAEPASANTSMASVADGRVSPDMFDSQPETVKITSDAVLETSEKESEVFERKTKPNKLPKTLVPTPVVEATKQKLLVDQPSFSESDVEPLQSLNLLIPESNTEYQSHSLLKSAKHSMKGDKASKDPLKDHIVPNSPKKGQAASKAYPSKVKPPPKPASDDSGAESSVESQVKAVKPSQSVAALSPSKNVDASSKSSSSSSDDSSSDEETVTQDSVVTQPTAPTSDDSSSYESDSSDDDTVTVPKAATRPSETVVKKAKVVSSSSESDSDSSEENDKTVKKVVNATDQPALKIAGKVSGVDAMKRVETATIQVAKSDNIPAKNHSSSSSDSEPKKESPQSLSKVKKLTKKKKSPKLALDTSEENPKADTCNTTEKSPHLSSTVMSGTDRLKEQMMVPDGISPILKSRHKTKTPSKPSHEKPYFDQVIATSKIGSQKSEVKSSGLENVPGKINEIKKKKKRKVAGFL